MKKLFLNSQLSLPFLLLVLNFLKVNGQTYHQLRVQKGTTYLANPTYTSEPTSTKDMTLRNVGTTFSARSVTQVCALGMWAMYNSTDYGEGLETSTSVLTIRGYDPQACATYTAYPALSLIKSVHWLGNADTTMPGLSIYSEPNFLGSVGNYPASSPPPTGPTPIGVAPAITSIRLGSFAITGPGKWRLCADVACNNAICIDMSKYRGGFYLNRNVITDKSAAYPLYVRAYHLNPSMDECETDGGPPPPTSRSLPDGNGISGPKGKLGLEIF